MPQSYTLYELNKYIKRVIALNFAESIWINCEISQIKEVRGNVYLDLVHHDDKTDEIKAQISANIWYKSYLFIKNKLGALLPSLLKEGTHVLLKVKVEFNERYGIKLIIDDIDPSFTIGQMEMNRQKILQRLQEEGLIPLNKQHILPRVIQRIAIISSPNAAGYIDFINHLNTNSYGYKFDTTLYSAALQGLNTEREVCQALREIEDNKIKYDVIVIIRGGGSKLDLAWFDNFNIGSLIAKSSLPVITGIGHDIDSTVTDIMAHTSLKTPTAVADFLINLTLEFESEVHQTTYWISQMAQQLLKRQQFTLQNIIQEILWIPKDKIRNGYMMLSNVQNTIHQEALRKINTDKEKIILMDKEIYLSHPENILKRGYSIVRQNKKIAKTSKDIDSNHSFEIQFIDKTIKININE